MKKCYDKRVLTVVIFILMACVSVAGAEAASLLIEAGSLWKYTDTGANLGTEWRDVDHDDSGWVTGFAQLGYGDRDEDTLVGYGGDPDNKFITTYFRHSFSVTNPGDIANLRLRLLRDDGAVVYLNGTEVVRSNMPDGPISHLTTADTAIGGSEEDTFFEFAVDTGLLLPGTNVMAVEIHQGNPGSSDISFDLALLVSEPGQAALVKGPYLIYPGTNTQMTVLWQLDDTAPGTLEWGVEDTGYSDAAITSEYGSHQHQYTITGLTPGTRYIYRVIAGSDEYAGRFQAAPPQNQRNVKFLAYGDTRSYPADHDAVNGSMIDAYNVDPEYQTFTLHVGDWVNNGDSESDWTTQFFDPARPNTREFLANMPVNGCKGNHEQSGAVFQKYWPYPYVDHFYWSFDYGPAHVVVLDQYVSYAPGSDQYAWLVNDLAGTDKQWVFLVFHEPGWSAGGHGNNVVAQTVVKDLCKQHGYCVDIVFAGHNHYYARAEVEVEDTQHTVQHITTGGGGAPLYGPNAGYPNIVSTEQSLHFCTVAIEGNTLFFSARGLDGAVIDSFTLTGDVPDPIPGDVNNDGAATLSDALIVLQVLAGTAPPDVYALADADKDDVIGLPDALFVLQIVAGIRE